MKIFLDTADIDEIKQAHDLGLLDGVTTNPSLIAKSGRRFTQVIKEITQIVQGPVSAEVLKSDFKGMMQEAHELAKIASNVVIKLPLSEDGLRATKVLSAEGIDTNVTLCFSASQALLAAKAGATYVSPFIGRIDDGSWDGMQLISDIRKIYDNYSFATNILAASIRHPNHFKASAMLGADCATLPFGALQALFKHPLTDIGLDKFMSDAKSIEW